jgi:hypothetical protein
MNFSLTGSIFKHLILVKGIFRYFPLEIYNPLYKILRFSIK